MKTYKTLMITCVGLIASASSLAAWGYGNNQQHQDYEPADGYYSEPYYRGGSVSEANYDERAMGPYYNNDNKYDYNKNPSQMNAPKQSQTQTGREISMNESMNSGSYGSSNSGSMNNDPNSNNNSQGPRPIQGQFINRTGYISLNDTTSNVGERVRSAIQKDTALSSNARAVLVTADGNGQVTLSGSVASQAEKSKVESIVKSVEGVKSVKNNITIQNHR